ncbi:MAG: carboxypeptidase regulatory-like domain-containing protein [Pyrinomonadaceae bacterium]
MNKNFKFITGVLSILLCFTAIAFGQNTSGSIEGTISDPNGAVIPNATVMAKSTGSTAGFNGTVTTNSEGYFQFPQVPIGTYTITATSTNFKTSTRDITVSLDKSAIANFKLEIGASSVTVDVTSDTTTTIDQADTKIDTNITKQVFDALPKGTNFTTLLKTAPNVRPEALSGGFQVDGASGSENVFVIDGQEVTNFRTGVLNSNNNLPFELLQEVQIKSTGFEAEYGGATGGVINVVTSGGNDSLRGNFAISFRPKKLQGDFRNILSTFGTNAAGNFEYFNPNEDGGTDFFPVAQIGGPIVKGKLWFNASYAPQIFETTRSIDYFSSNNPATRSIVETLDYNQTLRQEYAFVRLDAQPHSKLRLFGSFLWNPLIQKSVLPGINTGLSGSPTPVNVGGQSLRGPDLLGQQGGRQNANNINGQATYTPTSWLVVNFRAGRSFLNERLNSYGLPRETRIICSALGVQTAATTGCSQGFNNIPNNNQINFDVSTRTTYDADASFVGINAGGRHNFKFGYQFNRLFNTVSNGYKNLGIIQLFYDRDITALTGIAATPGNLGAGLLQRFGTVGEASSKNQALFVQDSWQIMSRLTINAGFRIEKETVPNFGTTGSQAIEFGWGDKITPRLGVAFDPTGSGKTKIFASYGWFYDRFKYELPRGSFGGDFFRRDFFEILPGRGSASGLLFSGYNNFGAILGSNPDPIGGTCPIVGGTGWSRCQFDFRVATNLIGADIFETGAVDPALKAARQSEYTFGVERQLGSNFLLAARYTHKQQDRAIEDVGVFNAQGSEAYIIGNPGFGLVCTVAATANLPCAKAEREYDAVEVRVDKRSSNYFYNASYTWSRLFGNYSGLASSDEFGRTSPNVNRMFDLPPLGFTADGDPDNGKLATDRPHVFKAFGGYSWNWFGNSTNRTTISGFTTIQSGTPLTTIYNLYSLGTTILNGRGDLGRTEMFTETDISFSHRYKFGRDTRFILEPYIDLRNVFDEANVLGVNTNISATNFTGATLSLAQAGCTTCATEAAVFQTIFNGVGIRNFVNNYVNNTTVTPLSGQKLNTYGLANNFQVGRDVRFGVRFMF